ncbi:MAG: sigma-70 family RNA polymerase sigma factor [Myxococcales bacterium]|nr:sigma-70 family RNA polymerase sigma factor [Myxococcales bacterium]
MSEPANVVDPKELAREREIRTMCERGDDHGATTLALRLYGREILQFLVHTHRDEQAASEVFSLISEDVWRGLATFRWQSTLRGWLYAVARNASHEFRRSQRRHCRSVPMSHDERVFLDVAAQIRTETLTFLRTESRSALDRLRDELTVDERMLLSLRLDRGLSWPEIAEIYATESEALGNPSKDAARLRKRFQLLKDRLRKRGRELGIIPSRDDV